MLYMLIFQIMTSVPQEHTTAVVTPHAITPKVHTCAAVYPAILETGNFAKVKCSLRLRSEIN